jgi:hypothetical protein
MNLQTGSKHLASYRSVGKSNSKVVLACIAIEEIKPQWLVGAVSQSYLDIIKEQL